MKHLFLAVDLGFGISAALALMAAGLTVVLAIEAKRLLLNQLPLTFFTRQLVMRYPHVLIPIFALVSFIVGLFVAHFGWDACRDWSGTCH